jgi:hypothetical protein
MPRQLGFCSLVFVAFCVHPQGLPRMVSDLGYTRNDQMAESVTYLECISLSYVHN